MPLMTTGVRTNLL